MEKFERYLAAFDGVKEWPEIAPLFDDLFDDDLVVVTADGEMDKAQWAVMAQGLAERHATVSDLEFSAEDAESAHYRLTIEVGDDDPIYAQAKATIKDGRFVRVEPVDPDAYSELVERSR